MVKLDISFRMSVMQCVAMCCSVWKLMSLFKWALWKETCDDHQGFRFVFQWTFRVSSRERAVSGEFIFSNFQSHRLGATSEVICTYLHSTQMNLIFFQTHGSGTRSEVIVIYAHGTRIHFRTVRGPDPNWLSGMHTAREFIFTELWSSGFEDQIPIHFEICPRYANIFSINFETDGSGRHPNSFSQTCTMSEFKFIFNWFLGSQIGAKSKLIFTCAHISESIFNQFSNSRIQAKLDWIFKNVHTTQIVFN